MEGPAGRPGRNNRLYQQCRKGRRHCAEVLTAPFRTAPLYRIPTSQATPEEPRSSGSDDGSLVGRTAGQDSNDRVTYPKRTTTLMKSPEFLVAGLVLAIVWCVADPALLSKIVMTFDGQASYANQMNGLTSEFVTLFDR